MAKENDIIQLSKLVAATIYFILSCFYSLWFVFQRFWRSICETRSCVGNELQSFVYGVLPDLYFEKAKFPSHIAFQCARGCLSDRQCFLETITAACTCCLNFNIPRLTFFYPFDDLEKHIDKELLHERVSEKLAQFNFKEAKFEIFVNGEELNNNNVKSGNLTLNLQLISTNGKQSLVNSIRNIVTCFEPSLIQSETIAKELEKSHIYETDLLVQCSHTDGKLNHYPPWALRVAEFVEWRHTSRQTPLTHENFIGVLNQYGSRDRRFGK